MIIEPSVGEVAFYCVLFVIGLTVLIAARLPWNSKYNPKGDDPYKYCPKEDDYEI